MSSILSLQAQEITDGYFLRSSVKYGEPNLAIVEFKNEVFRSYYFYPETSKTLVYRKGTYKQSGDKLEVQVDTTISRLLGTGAFELAQVYCDPVSYMTIMDSELIVGSNTKYAPRSGSDQPLTIVYYDMAFRRVPDIKKLIDSKITNWDWTTIYHKLPSGLIVTNCRTQRQEISSQD
jgi:hypothetical protein